MRWAPLARTVLLAVLVAGCGDDGDGPTPDSGSLFPDVGGGSGCSPATCWGCCQGDTCMPGTEASACGTGGQVCQSCPAGTTCQNGTCGSGPPPPQCNAQTCSDGCCDTSGICQPGDTESQCGTNGATCAICQGDDTCAAGVCSPPSKITVTLVEATNIPLWGCEILSKCELFVKLTVGTQTATSAIRKSSKSNGVITVTWNEDLLQATESEITSMFDVRVYDEDPNKNVLKATCRPQVTAADIAAGSISFECNKAADTKVFADMTFEFK